MKSFKNRFNTLLLTEEDTSSYGNPQYDGMADSEEFDNGLEVDTDPEEFEVNGLKDAIAAVKESFNKKMSEFADTLDDASLEAKTLSEIKDDVNSVYKYVKGIEVFIGAKNEVGADNPKAIIAGFIAADPVKSSAFKTLVSNLENFADTFKKTEGALDDMKEGINDFVEEVVSKDMEDAEVEKFGRDGVDNDELPVYDEM
jgi:hypothetical protein|tara:strand:+ start:668 stop:1267 length:600 start_codon:yes stop_codon:yes gene_type:complete